MHLGALSDDHSGAQIGLCENFTPPPFSTMNVLRTMTPRTLPMYFHSIGGQHNHIHNDVLVELGREPQQNILFHIYIYTHICMIIHGTKH
jgi:hypothetical protein